MNAELLCAAVAVFNLAIYWLSGIPEVWASAVDMTVEEGASPDRARLKLGWHRFWLLSIAVMAALLGAVPC